MPVTFVIREISQSPEIMDGLAKGVFILGSGTIRRAKGTDGAGQIVSHLLFPTAGNNSDSALEPLMKQLQGSSPSLQLGMQSLQALQVANLALAGLNLAVSAAGFVVVCKKLNQLAARVESLHHKVDELIQRDNWRQKLDEIAVIAHLKAAIQSIESAVSSNSAIPEFAIFELSKLYQFTLQLILLLLKEKPYETLGLNAGMLEELLQRLQWIAFAKSYAYANAGQFENARQPLTELQSDWALIHDNMRPLFAPPRAAWISSITSGQQQDVLTLVNRRRLVAPGIEYQESLLDFCQTNQIQIRSLPTNSESAFFITSMEV